MSVTIDGTYGINKFTGIDVFPAGVPIQVVNTIYTSRTSFTIQTYDTDVPGGSITITPKGNNSKFLITVRYFFESDSSYNIVYNIQRNGTRINVGGLTNNWSGIAMATQTYGGGNDNSSTPEILNFSTLDTSGSTAGTPITFKLVSSSDTARTSYVNRVFSSDGTSAYENGTSEIIIMEIKG